MGYSCLKKSLAVSVFFAFLTACGDDKSSSSNGEELYSSSALTEDTKSSSSRELDSVEMIPGFAFVESQGKSVKLGTFNENAKAIERPQMQVDFSYDFYLGVHEVSCGEYRNLSQAENVDGCENDSLPVTNISFYDAVLFANAYSKKLKLDTVYSYTSAKYDQEGHCTSLEDFSFRNETIGVRLPTEAEWTYVAQGHWNPSDGWTLENSKNVRHKICTAQDVSDSSNVYCDMAGNVMEWMNDWLGSFKETSVTNYAGAPDGGNLGQRVVKGGSFRNPSEAINLYNRGDVYAVVSSSRADYVGFRLAIGAIPDAVWIGADGQAVNYRMTPVASGSEVKNLTKAYSAKLAFRNDVTGNLAFIDYQDGTPAVIEIRDTIDSYHPEISPDGRYVAFCTGLEGVGTSSKIYVRHLDEKGSGLTVLDVKGAAIPRWRITEKGDTVIIFVSSAGNNENESSFLEQSTWMVSFEGGKFGSPQKLFEGAYHGGVDLERNIAVTGARRLRAYRNGSHEVWYNGEQACNVSLSQDGLNQTLFLDFAGKTGRDFVGKSYRTHERLFIADSTGKLVQSISAPSALTFDHSEWVSRGDNAVATLVNSEGAHERIVLVNSENGSITTLVLGDELWHPNLWVEPIDTVAEHAAAFRDSAGVYYSSISASHHLSYRMEMLWRMADMLEIVGLGNSHMAASFCASRMKMQSLNAATMPSDMHVNLFLFKNYLIRFCPKLKYVILGLDFDLWDAKDTNRDIDLNIGDAPGFAYDANHGYWSEGVSEEFLEKVKTSVVKDGIYNSIQSSKGFVHQNYYIGWSVGDDHSVEILSDSTWSDDPLTYEDDLAALDEFIQIAKEHHITVIGSVTPISPYYQNTGAYSRHGMRRSCAYKIYDRIKAQADSTENFILFDENHFGNHDYGDDLSHDYDHLNTMGAVKFTSRLDSLIQTLEGRISAEER